MKKIFIVSLILLAALAGTIFYYNRLEAPTVPASTIAENDSVIVQSPRVNEVIKSPVSLYGNARGVWFFEASFPIRILDGDGSELGRGHAEAQGDWMTTDFVPFNATITFSEPKFREGSIVLDKDNPSGLPQNARELKIAVRFK